MWIGILPHTRKGVKLAVIPTLQPRDGVSSPPKGKNY